MSAPQDGPESLGVDLSIASVARMYDYLLGGKDNYAVDREAVVKLRLATPDIDDVARRNRMWLQRVVYFAAAELGIRQFLDFGTGLPTQRTVHEVAQEIHPDVRVVYADNDPIVLAHGRALLEDNDRTIMLDADMAQPDTVLRAPEVLDLIDFGEPVAAIYASVLHCLPDEAHPYEVVKRVRDALPSGSCLGLSHLESEDQAAAEALTESMRKSTPYWGRVRDRSEIRRFFDGFDVVEPGLGDIAEWWLDIPAVELPLASDYVRPSTASPVIEFGGAGIKR
ncbi:S-adenosyl methyltransferase [Saccharopolyspora shandongensis]|uniref:S-adenosyl methyltransferase n=1 Tax=Saccharopolyspora shandongensis TaxID=418495 RepID=A0A1H3G5Y8_9PSEU|nr:SAM-dependent methyltransferase [Saccharopolyspora shandongensis]SDX98686.1 S-adenosyl methyltransferase [Saccharopolyspora shandongensis]